MLKMLKVVKNDLMDTINVGEYGKYNFNVANSNFNIGGFDVNWGDLLIIRDNVLEFIIKNIDKINIYSPSLMIYLVDISDTFKLSIYTNEEKSLLISKNILKDKLRIKDEYLKEIILKTFIFVNKYTNDYVDYIKDFINNYPYKLKNDMNLFITIKFLKNGIDKSDDIKKIDKFIEHAIDEDGKDIDIEYVQSEKYPRYAYGDIIKSKYKNKFITDLDKIIIELH